MANGPALVSRSGRVCPLKSTTLIRKNAVLDKSESAQWMTGCGYREILARRERYVGAALLTVVRTLVPNARKAPRVTIAESCASK
jgi:hypothetical protein